MYAIESWDDLVIALYFRVVVLFSLYFGPPIAAVFILGVFWKKINSQSTMWTLIIGGILGIIRTILELFNLDLNLNQPFLHWSFSINYLHYAILLFLFSIILATSISLFSMSKIPVKINEYMLASGELTAIFHGKRILTKGEKPDRDVL